MGTLGNEPAEPLNLAISHRSHPLDVLQEIRQRGHVHATTHLHESRRYRWQNSDVPGRCSETPRPASGSLHSCSLDGRSTIFPVGISPPVHPVFISPDLYLGRFPAWSRGGTVARISKEYAEGGPRGSAGGCARDDAKFRPRAEA